MFFNRIIDSMHILGNVMTYSGKLWQQKNSFIEYGPTYISLISKSYLDS
jgi:hypothetical protein